MLELFSSTVPDPLEQIVSEHLQVFLRILESSPSIWEEVQRSWPLIHSRLEASPHPWKVVSGPVSAMIQYAKDMGWDVNSPTSWIIQGEPWPLTFGPFLYQDLRRLIKSTVRQSRLEAISTPVWGRRSYRRPGLDHPSPHCGQRGEEASFPPSSLAGCSSSLR